MKKTRLNFFFQRVQKMFEILEKTIVKFSPKSGQKIIHYNFWIMGGLCSSSLYPHFRKELRPLHPLKGLPLPGPEWKAIDWNSSPLVLMYYWLTFLNKVRYLNFRHFFCFSFETNFTGVFFMILTIFWLFIYYGPCPK